MTETSGRQPAGKPVSEYTKAKNRFCLCGLFRPRDVFLKLPTFLSLAATGTEMKAIFI